MMAHNVSQHIESVQRANQLADVAYVTHDVDVRDWRRAAKSSSTALEINPWVPRNLIYFEQLVEEVFTSETPMQVIKDNTALLADCSKGAMRKTSNTVFSDFFDDASATNNAGSDQTFNEDDAIEKLQQLNG
jgi:hypothetical protein